MVDGRPAHVGQFEVNDGGHGFGGRHIHTDVVFLEVVVRETDGDLVFERQATLALKGGAAIMRSEQASTRR